MKLRRIHLVAGIAALVMTGLVAYAVHRISAPAIDLGDKKSELVYIPTGATFDEVCQLLTLDHRLTDPRTFGIVADLMKYSTNVKAGCYEIDNRMTAVKLVRKLRSGNQHPLNVTFNNIRSLSQLAGHVGRRIETDSAQLIAVMTDSGAIAAIGFDSRTIPAMFIPDTYQFHWNTSASQWLERMHTEWKRFWNSERTLKAEALGLSPIEVSTLASIVDEETAQNDEKPTVAGLYINRLRKGIPLQADPTVKFALGDFGIRRILKKDLEVESPYNTYRHAGLPPGPIRIASKQGIEAVLNARKHNYLYMCAKEDFSGYHNFAVTLAEHNRNAAKYQRELGRHKIYR